jgi:hypothetical protein
MVAGGGGMRREMGDGRRCCLPAVLRDSQHHQASILTQYTPLLFMLSVGSVSVRILRMLSDALQTCNDCSIGSHVSWWRYDGTIK